MDKQAFLAALSTRLSGLPQADLEERLNFYSEMIDDYVEEGLSESEAVCKIGTVDDIVIQILEDTPLSRIAKARIHLRRKRSSFETAMLILGAPIWLSLLISAFAVVFSLYVSLWAAVISIWSGFVSIAAGAFCGIWGGVYLAVTGYGLSGGVLIGLGLVCVGLSILAFFVCKVLTKGAVYLTKKMVLLIKNRLMKKEVS